MSKIDTQSTAPAGWYDDPEGSDKPRWFDGLNWTETFFEGDDAGFDEDQVEIDEPETPELVLDASNEALPADWYRDYADASLMRWWDGDQWSDEVMTVERYERRQQNSRQAQTQASIERVRGFFYGVYSALYRTLFGHVPAERDFERKGHRREFVIVAIVVSVVVVAGSISWDLYGSNWWAAREQKKLSAQLDAPVIAPSIVTTTSTIPVDPNTPTTAAPAIAASPAALTTSDKDGAPYARIRIPAIGVDQVVVHGVSDADLAKGPGWIPETAEPGDAGNAVISGHRTTHGAPFYKLDKLKTGDQIIVSIAGRPDAVYEVRAQFNVYPTDSWVANPTAGARLTLTTCTPIHSDKQRLIIQAELVSGAAEAKALPASQWQASHKP